VANPGTTDLTTWFSKFCSYGPRPLIMDGIIRELLKQHFSVATNVEHTPLTSRLFTDVPATNNILIEEFTVWTPQQAKRRLAIIIKQNDWQCIKRGTFDNISGTTTEGFKKYTKYWRGSHTLFAIAAEGGEAKILAAEVYRYFNHFGPKFREYFGLMMFELVNVGAPALIEEWDQHWGVPITIGYGWADEWTLKPDAPVIANMSVSDIFGIY